MTTLNGQGVSRGTALGKVAFYRRSGQEIEPSAISDVPAELERFEKACGQAAEELEQLYAETLSTLGEENALLFQIHEIQKPVKSLKSFLQREARPVFMRRRDARMCGTSVRSARDFK